MDRIGTEHRYFEFVNTLRLLSRELFTKVNPEKQGAAARVDALLQELRDKLFFFNEAFGSRFLNEEIRNSEFYEEGSALRQLATVKEVFATHLALLWMAVKSTHGAFRGKNLGEDELYKVNFIIKSVQSLLQQQGFVAQVLEVTRDITDFERPSYKAADVAAILNTFESDTKPADDVAKLTRIQTLYTVVHKYFMQKAGNYDLPYELAQDDKDYLFSKEVRAAEGVNRSQLEADKKATARKDFVQVAMGEDHDDNMDMQSVDEHPDDTDVNEGALLLDNEAEEDFAYLKHQVEARNDRDWHLETGVSTNDVQIYRHTARKGWASIVLKCVAHLDHIPKHIVFRAISDMNLRAKWDQTLGEIEVLEHKKDLDQTYVRCALRVPHHLQTREAVLVRKVLKDFPQINQSSIVLRSSEHARCPENLRAALRPEMRMNGFVLEDDKSGRGTRLSWFLQNDLRGSLPSSMLINLHTKYQAAFVAQLVKACQQIVKGSLK